AGRRAFSRAADSPSWRSRRARCVPCAPGVRPALQDERLRALALPPFRPALFFCAVVPPCFARDALPRFVCERSPPRFDAPGEFEMRAARAFDMPFFFSASYCFSFLMVGRFLPDVFFFADVFLADVFFA